MPKIAIIDVETSGLEATHHEILEVGMVVFDLDTFSITDLYESKVRPERIEDAEPRALEVNGYDHEEWEGAPSLHEVMMQLYERTQDTTFCAHNMIFDWSFLQAAEKKTGIILPFGRHKIDLLTLAWGKLPHDKVHAWSLKTICTYLHILPEPKRHRALNGALAEYAVFTKLMSS